jgi:hypothetical protein
VPKAADLLGRLPGERARRIAHAVSMTGNVDPETVRRIGLSLYHRDLVAALGQVPGGAGADDAGTHHNNMHNKSPCVRPPGMRKRGADKLGHQLNRAVANWPESNTKQPKG